MKDKKVRILFVDDNEIDRMAFERFADNEDFPFDYIMAESIRKARNILESEKFDAVVLDYLLGDGTAFDLFEKAEDIPIIIVTSIGDEEIAVQAMKKGASDYLIKDPEGNHLKTLSVTIEKVISLKRAKEKLRKTEERFQDLAKKSNLIPWEVDLSTLSFTYVGPQVVDLFGYPIEEWFGCNFWYNHIHPEDRDWALKFYHEHTDKFYEFEYRMMAADGRIVWVRDMVNVIHGKDDPNMLIGFFLDITERKQVEEELAKHRHHLEELVKARTAELTKVNEQLKQEITDHKRTEEALEKSLKDSQQHQKEISALLEGARAVQEYHEFKKTARAIYDICKKIIGSTAGYVALLSSDGKENELLFLDAGRLKCTVDTSLPMPIRGLRAEAYHKRKTVYDNDFLNSKWIKFIPKEHAPLENVMFAPLIIKRKAVGLIGFANKRGGFTENDSRIASAFAEIAAVALRNSQTLESLENSEEHFRSVAQTANSAIITVNSEGNIVYWNQAAERIFGYSVDEIKGKSLTMIMPEQFHQAHNKGLKHLVSTGDSKIIGKTTELIGLKKYGEEFPLELSLSSWKTKEGIFFTGILNDITERKMMEKMLRLVVEGTANVTGEDFLNSMVRQLATVLGVRYMLVGEVIFPKADRIKTLAVYANGDYADNLEYDLAGTPCAEVVKRGICYYPKNIQQQFPQDRLLVEMEAESYMGLPLIDSSGKTLGILAALHDKPIEKLSFIKPIMTILATRAVAEVERKKVVEELKTAKEEAERANLAKSQFLSHMSHELRTPMNSILGFSQLLQSDPTEPLSTSQEESVAQVLKSGRHLLDLINDVLDLSRIESGNLQILVESVVVDHLMEEVITLVEPIAYNYGVTLKSFVCKSDSHPIMADPTRLKQVMLNLVSNAVKYNKAGGYVKLSCEETSKGFLRISVHDNGLGIPEDRPRNFIAKPSIFLDTPLTMGIRRPQSPAICPPVFSPPSMSTCGTTAPEPTGVWAAATVLNELLPLALYFLPNHDNW